MDDHADAAWEGPFEDLFLRIGHRFGRADLRRLGRDYLRGLLAPIARKNGWRLAEFAGHRAPDGLQRLLNRANWDADDVRDDLQSYVAEHLGEDDGVLVIDDTGFLKRGTTSAGVQRQQSGPAGRAENCQIGVFAAYASTVGRALVDRELYLPKSWTDDRDRCRAAKVPDERDFATKGELAKRLVLRALASDLPFAWVAADTPYGQDGRLRRLLEQSGLGYVLAVPKSQQVFGPRIDQLFAQTHAGPREPVSCGVGAEGARGYRWAALELPMVAGFDCQGQVPVRRRWALVCRSHDSSEDAYFLAYAPLDTTVEELTRVAGKRRQIEECLQGAKEDCGLDQYEVRRYVGWYRHVTLSMLAHAHLAVMTAGGTVKGGAETLPAPWSRSSRQKSAGARRCVSSRMADPVGHFARRC
ncbi:IS701 family transposase [Streptomyces lavendulae]|uniref:IS701 family transposase n=2 Tax=Streptomyces lavendulae TaxID=1914 RepID=UPI0036AB8D9D